MISCIQSDDMDINNYIDHWEINTTIKTYKNSTLYVDTVDNEYQILTGNNHVLILTIEKKPVFKEGKKLTDMYSAKSFLIELNTLDTFITAENPSNSKLYRKLIAFSPDYGISPLSKDEKVIFKRKDEEVWTVESYIHDFVFSGRLDFSTDQTLTVTINEN